MLPRAVVVCVSGAAMGADASGLKPIDPAAFQASIERLAKDLMLPGAMVLLSTPQGDIVFGYGTNELGTTNPPRADTHFRAASNTKTMTAAVDRADGRRKASSASTMRSRNMSMAFRPATRFRSASC